MEVIRGIKNIKDQFRSGSALTIGNFDGVHLGHKSLLQELTNAAQSTSSLSVVLLFEPHPQEFLGAGKSKHIRITTLEEKLLHLQTAGIDYVVVADFNSELASTMARDFVENILIDKFNIKTIILGYDFKFGYKREGDINLLNELGKKHAFEVMQVDAYLKGKEIVSSTLVRRLLKESSFSSVEGMLGRKYSMFGEVIEGQKTGRNLGFKTANIELKHNEIPLNGVYAVTIVGLDQDYQGVACIGMRTIAPNDNHLLEVHILDFNVDIYGISIEVVFHMKIRELHKFSSTVELKRAIGMDIQETQRFFAIQ